MKLQNLIIIFIIIIIPIILLFSYYLKLEANTILMQTDYDAKLIEATGEAMEAYVVNSTENSGDYNNLDNKKRYNIESSISTFTISLANKLGIGGTSKENMLQFIPAMVYIMYDGYYIYAPTNVPQTVTDDGGKQLYYSQVTNKLYVDLVNKDDPTDIREIAYVPNSYSDGSNITAAYGENNYTFNTDISKANLNWEYILKTFIPYSKKIGNYVVNYTLDDYVKIYGNGISKEGYVLEDNTFKQVGFEELKEYIPINADGGTVEYPYIYNENGEKRYYDEANDMFFKIYGFEKQYLKYVSDISEGEFQKMIKRDGNSQKEVYRLLNKMEGTDERDYNWYINKNKDNIYYDANTPNIKQDCSANNYYVETYFFNKWIIDNSISLEMDKKQDYIISDIQKNLYLSIANYNANSRMGFQFPKVSDEDWEQALSNVSIIAFFQGVKTGLKTYNNYAVVSSADTAEFVSEDSIYFINSNSNSSTFEFYHRLGCSSITGTITGYRNNDFKINKSRGTSYYRHSYYYNGTTKKTYSPCYNCIINRNNLLENEAIYQDAYDKAIARERYQLIEQTRLDKI